MTDIGNTPALQLERHHPRGLTHRARNWMTKLIVVMCDSPSGAPILNLGEHGFHVDGRLRFLVLAVHTPASWSKVP